MTQFEKFDIEDYCRRLEKALLAEFGEKLCYMGLQGSYLRNEATESSDIDIMVILQTLTAEDMDTYRRIIEGLGDADRACGFICSAEDMRNWNPLEACQLLYTTKDLYGKLCEFLPRWTIEDEVNYIKMSLNNLYHALCHSYIHGNREKLTCNLPFFYKSAYFILQNTHYLESCRQLGKNAEFILPTGELAEKSVGEDKEILEALMYLKAGGEVDFDRHYKLLLYWCQHKMAAI